MAIDRRTLLTRSAVVAGAAWVTPTVLSLDAASAASGCGCVAAPVQFLTAQPSTAFTPSPGPCVTYVNVTLPVCRISTTQIMRLASNSLGTTAPLFDELGVITVTSPTNVTKVLNVIFYQNDCRDITGTDLTGPTGPVDISALFSGECGVFTINIQVRNRYSPYQWGNTWVVPA